jgi:dolichyl-phosphate beta-glucosyltransferase
MAGNKVNDGNAEITASGLIGGIAKQLRLLWQLNKLWLIFLTMSVAFMLIVEVSGRVIVSYVGCHFVAGFFKWLLLPIINVQRGSRDTVFRSEQSFFDPKTQNRINFPSLHDAATLDLSLVIPAWNEEKRLPPMLDATLAYFKHRLKLEPNLTFEIIIVDDGSSDRTAQVVQNYIRQHPEGTEKIRLLKAAHNRGKGGAVREGMLRTRGRRLLMVDADGATDINDLDKLESKLAMAAKNRDLALVVGSRYWLEVEANVTRTPFRKFLMHGFRLLVQTLCATGVKDTQCGFKLFTRDAARKLFPVQHIENWAFDVELLFLASRLGVTVCEESVRWQEIEGSKLDLRAPLDMLRDIALIRFCYTFGIWKDKVSLQSSM